MKESLGLIETIGLTAGIEAIDASAKAANVTVIGYELTKGSGMTTVKLEGDVGAVKAAVDAGAAAAAMVGKVVSTLVIPRPEKGIEGMIRNMNTVGYTPEKGESDPEPEEKDNKPEKTPSAGESKEKGNEEKGKEEKTEAKASSKTAAGQKPAARRRNSRPQAARTKTGESAKKAPAAKETPDHSKDEPDEKK